MKKNSHPRRTPSGSSTYFCCPTPLDNKNADGSVHSNTPGYINVFFRLAAHRSTVCR